MANSCLTRRTLTRQPCYHSYLIKGTPENQKGRATCSKSQSQQLQEQDSGLLLQGGPRSSAEKRNTGTPLVVQRFRRHVSGVWAPSLVGG